MDIYKPVPDREKLLIRPGERVRLITAPYDLGTGTPSPIGEVFEEDEQFVFARASGPRFKRHPIFDGLLLSRGRISDVALKRFPNIDIAIERTRNDLNLEVHRQFDDALIFVTRKKTGEDFSDEFVLHGPDDYSFLKGAHKIDPGEAARIVCGGRADFAGIRNFPESGNSSWHAGDLIFKDGFWSFHNPRGETEETSQIALKPGNKVVIGRDFEEGWHLEAFQVNPNATGARPFYGSAIPPELNHHSRFHVTIEIQEDGGARISDFSSNGTLVCVKSSTDPFRETVRLRRARPIGDGQKYDKGEYYPQEAVWALVIKYFEEADDGE